MLTMPSTINRMSIIKNLFSKACFWGLLSCSASVLFAVPEWWGTRQVLSNTPPDDFAVANLGQLKTLAKKAREQMDETLPDGAGTEITTLIERWENGSSAADDFAALTLGQLKTVGGMFRRRVAGAWPDLSNQPWLEGNPDDYALATLGQLKTVFAFEITDDPLGGGGDDYDRDGLSNAQEAALGTNPRLHDSDGDGIGDGQELAEGTHALDAQSSSAVSLALSFRSQIE